MVGDSDLNAEILDAIQAGDADRLSLLLGHVGGVDFVLQEGKYSVRQTALHQALQAKRHALVPLLLEWGADPNSENSSGWVPLDTAMMNGAAPELLQLLLDRGADPHWLDSEGDSFLHKAVSSPEQTRFWVEQGLSVKAINHQGRTPLHHALEYESLAAIEELIRAGETVPREFALHLAIFREDFAEVRRLGIDVDLNQLDRFGRTYLELAVHRGNPQTVAILLELGADPNLEDDAGRAALFHTAHSNDVRMVEALLAGGADVNAIHLAEEPALFNCFSGFTEVNVEFLAKVRALVEAGAWLYYEDDFPRNILISALREMTKDAAFHQWERETFQYLLSARDGDVLIEGRGADALVDAVQKNSIGAVELLLRAGVHPDESDHNGQVALPVAVRCGNAEILEQLIAAGASVPERDEEGRSLLRLARQAADPRIEEIIGRYLSEPGFASGPMGLVEAIELNDREAVRRMIAGGANPDVITNSNTSALIAAVELSNPAMVGLLLELEANPDHCVEDGPITRNLRSPLAVAAMRGEAECARLLLEAGADPEAGWGEDNTPLFIAAQEGELEIVELLLAAGADPFAFGYKTYLPFSRAARDERYDIMSVLLEAMHGREKFEEYFQLCFRSVVYDERVGAARWMLERMPDLYNRRDTHYHEYPIYGAALRGNVELIELIASRGPCHINTACRGDDTPLLVAVLQGGLNAVRALVAAGADVNFRPPSREPADSFFRPSDYTPLFITCVHKLDYREYPGIAAFLCEHGADVNALDAEGNSPLMVAVRSGLYAVIEVLLRFRPDRTIRNHQGQDVHDLAAARGAPEIGTLLARMDSG